VKYLKTPRLVALTALVLANGDALAACAPRVLAKVDVAPYKALSDELTPALPNLTAKLAALNSSFKYEVLEDNARALADGLIPLGSGRVVITLPDGTVVIDTGKDDTTNTYANFQAKTINENHNTRVAILDAQLYDCGVGVETKKSSTTGTSEHYVAKRLGAYLRSAGTARISQKN
jgi:hypothetical protein